MKRTYTAWLVTALILLGWTMAPAQWGGHGGWNSIEEFLNSSHTWKAQQTFEEGVVMPTMDSGTSTYTPGSGVTFVNLDLSKTWHYINHNGTSGVSIQWTNVPTLTSATRTYFVQIKQAGATAGTVVWTGPTEHPESGTSPTLTTTLGEKDTFAVNLSSETGSTKQVTPADSTMR